MSAKALSTAIYIAALAHLNQLDKGGNPYIFHPLHIMNQLAAQRRDYITQIIGVLHDVTEDTDWTEERLRAEGIPEEALEGLRLMHHGKDVDYFDYIGAMKDNLRVLYVKREDITHNSLLIRLKGLRDKDFARFDKYIRAYAMITKMIEHLEDLNKFKSEHLR